MAESSSIIKLKYPDQQIGALRYKAEDISLPWADGKMFRIIGLEAEPQTISGMAFYATEKDALDDNDILEAKVNTQVNLQFYRGPQENEELFYEKLVQLKDIRSEIPQRVIINGLLELWRVRRSLTIERLR